jgi:GMP synthase (glutamine-hydrolysing)
VGTTSIELTQEGRTDPLFRDLPQRLQVNQSHRDEVHTLTAELVQLASSGHTDVQSIAAGEHVRGVQFHPEMTGTIIRRILGHRRVILTDDFRARSRPNTVEELITGSGDTPHAEAVLVNFARHFVRAA